MSSNDPPRFYENAYQTSDPNSVVSYQMKTNKSIEILVDIVKKKIGDLGKPYVGEDFVNIENYTFKQVNKNLSSLNQQKISDYITDIDAMTKFIEDKKTNIAENLDSFLKHIHHIPNLSGYKSIKNDNAREAFKYLYESFPHNNSPIALSNNDEFDIINNEEASGILDTTLRSIIEFNDIDFFEFIRSLPKIVADSCIRSFGFYQDVHFNHPIYTNLSNRIYSMNSNIDESSSFLPTTDYGKILYRYGILLYIITFFSKTTLYNYFSEDLEYHTKILKSTAGYISADTNDTGVINFDMIKYYPYYILAVIDIVTMITYGKLYLSLHMSYSSQSTNVQEFLDYNLLLMLHTYHILSYAHQKVESNRLIASYLEMIVQPNSNKNVVRNAQIIKLYNNIITAYDDNASPWRKTKAIIRNEYFFDIDKIETISKKFMGTYDRHSDIQQKIPQQTPKVEHFNTVIKLLTKHVELSFYVGRPYFHEIIHHYLSVVPV